MFLKGRKMYNKNSHNAEEFISHEEILETLKFADEIKKI